MLPVRDKVAHTALRIKFTKTGKLRYISHLDLHRTFSRMLVRCGIPVWYSEGFSPHPRLVFATPLSVGAESVCEYMDVYVIGSEDSIDLDVVRWKLRDSGIDGLEIKEAYIPKNKFSSITHSDYIIRISADGACEELAASCEKALCASPLIVLKRTKSGERDVDISTGIKSATAEFCDGEIVIKARLSADSASFLNPEYLIKVLKEQCGILSREELLEEYSIVRTAVLAGDADFC